MEEVFIRQTLIDRMRRHNESIEQAAASIARGFNVDPAQLAPAVEGIRREGRRNMVLDSPPGVYDHTAAEARISGWYTGPEDGDEFWPRLRVKLKSGSLADVIDEIDTASTKVVAHLADPHIQNLSKRGLVVGYVQSGKTANYTSVIAKAADAGYRLFIVLSGLHNNLRRQTQVRLSADLGNTDWAPLTSPDADFGNVLNGAAMLSHGVTALAVVKKNQARLRALRDWMRDIPEEIRRRVPILLLDDEADQATPNSATGREQYTRINQLVRQIWAEIPTGTYIGYTATPFANIFMDPNDEEELYPADFIIDLPRPAAYFGAERVFGREPLDDADTPDPGLDMVRDIPEEEAVALRPPTTKEGRSGYRPELPDTLISAVAWFVVATAIRRARGQVDAHSSMLVHTTHYIQPHFAMKERLEELLGTFMTNWESGDVSVFLGSFEVEGTRAAEVASGALPAWRDIEVELGAVLADVRVVVDNGASDDRLDYGRTIDGEPIVETVIAVGGGTLSRGLTLEGLVVSYFTRTSNTYDTLLQMGRWFGYRPGYEDLPRIWLQASLADEFKFLALVEEEIRQDMLHMERMKATPRDLGVRVRAHPGRLAIVAKNKMQHADIVRISYSGQRLQTIIFDESGGSGAQRNNLAATTHLMTTLGRDYEPTRDRGRWSFSGVPSAAIVDFIKSYRFHPDQVGMRADHMAGWIERAAQDRAWNVVVMGSERKHRGTDGQTIDLGRVDIGLGESVPTTNRAPLKAPLKPTANIKALLSHSDWFADLDPQRVREMIKSSHDDPRAVRRSLAGGRGLLIIYPVSKNSVPMGVARRFDSRRRMASDEHLIGVGLIFPDVDVDTSVEGGTYFSVHPDWEVELPADEDEIPEDRELSLTIDGDDLVSRP